MSDEFKPRSYEERKRIQEEIRKKNNERTRTEYRIKSGTKSRGTGLDGLPPTRDMQPVPLKLRKREEHESADVISINRKKEESK